MLLRLFTKEIKKIDVVFSPIVTLLTPVGVSSDGSACRKSEFKAFDIAGSLSAFTSSDFSIQNLESIGALSKLKTTYMSNMHDMNIADKFENFTLEVSNA